MSDISNDRGDDIFEFVCKGENVGQVSEHQNKKCALTKKGSHFKSDK